MALQVAVVGVAQLEALKACLRPGVRKPERQRNHAPPEDRANRIAPGRTGLMKTDTAVDRTRQAIASRAVNGKLSEQREHHKRKEPGYLTEPAAPERRQKKYDIDRHQQRDRNEETEQQLAHRADIFE